jgi:hypothetical protein
MTRITIVEWPEGRRARQPAGFSSRADQVQRADHRLDPRRLRPLYGEQAQPICNISAIVHPIC